MPEPEMDVVGFISDLIAMGETCGVELACLAHLRALSEEFVTRAPSGLVDPILQAGWRPTFNGVMTLISVMAVESIVQVNRARLCGAMLVLLESMTRSDGDAYESAKKILHDTHALGDVLREMQAARRAREQAQIAANAAEPVDPALVAELENFDRVVVDELKLALPLPPWADARSSSEPTKVSFTAPGELAHLRTLYRAWAPGADWLMKMISDTEAWSAFELQRDGVEIGVLLNPWIDGRISISIELPRPLATRVVPSKGRVVVVPEPPPITREVLPALATPLYGTAFGEPVALLADGGLVFVVNTRSDVWMIDPHARRKTLVASNRETIAALTADGSGLLGVSSIPITVHGMGATASGLAGPVVVAGHDRHDRATAICCVGSTAFITCTSGQILVVKLPTGEIVTSLGGFTRELHALAYSNSLIYVLDDRVIHSIDRTTHAITQIIELPRAASSIASDGARIYVLHDLVISSVDLATKTLTQISGQPNFGTNQRAAAGGGAPRDGIGEGTVMERPRHLSYDAGNLWFTDNKLLRRFEIKALQTRTLDVG